jgi:hypothetical protein
MEIQFLFSDASISHCLFHFFLKKEAKTLALFSESAHAHMTILDSNNSSSNNDNSSNKLEISKSSK